MTSSDEAGGAPAARARVRMVSRPSSVSAVRRFVDQALVGWGRADLVEDVTLSASELATNATLHSGSTSFEVELSAHGPSVRIGVVDRGATSARSIADRGRAAATPRALGDASMGGRGLFIVAALAAAWGIEDLPYGTRVWAEFGPATGEGGAAAPEVSSAAEEPADVDLRVIELRGCPPDLLLAHDTNLADIARELHLFGSSHGDAATVAASEQIGQVVRMSAVSWDAARLAAQQGIADGRGEIDVAIAPSDVADVPRRIEVLRRAVDAAEAMMAQGLLITLPAPAPVQQWRDWVEGEMVAQATSGREPIRFADWLAGRRPTADENR